MCEIRKGWRTLAKKKKPEKDAESDVSDASNEASIDETLSDIADELKEDADPEQAPQELDAELLAQDAATEEASETEAPADDVTIDEGAEESKIEDIVEEPSETDAPSDQSITKSAPPTETVVVREGGFVPMVLGGLIAAAIGFGLARYVLPQPASDTALLTEIQRTLDGQTSAMTKLTSRIETLETGGDDLGGIEEGLATNVTAIATLADRLAGLETQLDRIESRPVSEGASGAALAAYETELQALQSAVDAMSENAALLEENAQAAAQATLRRAALTRIQTALDAGVEYDSAVADLEGLGIEVPAELKKLAATGVPSPTVLQDSFPTAARAALEASRGAADNAEQGGFASFLKTQLGARSLEPREGNDPDAILSRAEAAAREGRFTDALAEIEALPDVGRAELSDWSASVTERLGAVAAAQALSEQLN